MIIIAIDVETTGLDVQRDQILQIGAVMFDSNDTTTPIDDLPNFETLVRYDRYVGSAFALQMNQAILHQIAINDGIIMPIDEAIMALRDFVGSYNELSKQEGMPKPVPPYPLGFNVAAFDIAMLKGHGMPDNLIHHRAFELGTMFAHPDTGPASSSKIIPLLLKHDVAHTALQDARDAVALYRIWAARRDVEV